MPIFLLRPNVPDGTEPFVNPETAQGFVVVARHAAEARELVAFADGLTLGPGSEGSAPWINPGLTDCVQLSPTGQSRVVLRDFHHG